MIRWGIFASGEGTNLQNVLDLEGSGKLPNQQISCVHVDRPCRAELRAKTAHKAILHLSSKAEDYEIQLLNFLRIHNVDRIFLLGYMRVLKASFLKAWSKPIINLHPSLLPAHKGLRAIERAFEAGDAELGVSLHEVTEILDSGRLLLQLKWSRPKAASLTEIENKIHQLEYEVVRQYLIDLDTQEARRLGSRHGESGV